MNLKIELPGVKIELQNSDLARVEKTLIAAFAHVEGGSFVDTYNQTTSEERPTNSKRNHVAAVEGIKDFDGVKLYQCAYSCGCGNKGKRFVKSDADVTTCHKCEQTLSVMPAMEDGKCDEEFNYFVAY